MNIHAVSLLAALVVSASISPLCAESEASKERLLFYPTALKSGKNLLAGRSWKPPMGDTIHFEASKTKGGPFSAESPAWHIRLLAPEGGYWRTFPKIETGHKYLYGAWVQIDNSYILLRSYGDKVSDGTLYDQRLFCSGGFNEYIKPYLSDRMVDKLIGDPKEWKLCYRILSFPYEMKNNCFCAAMGVYLSTGAMTFSEPFLIDITDGVDRSLTVDIAGKKPFRRIAVVATGIGDIVWSKEFAEPVTSYCGTVPAEVADFERGQDERVIEGHTLEVTYVDGSVGRTHSPHEKIFKNRK